MAFGTVTDLCSCQWKQRSSQMSRAEQAHGSRFRYFICRVSCEHRRYAYHSRRCASPAFRQLATTTPTLRRGHEVCALHRHRSAVTVAEKDIMDLSPNPPMDGARIGEGGEEVTDATVRARIRVDWRLAGGLSALLGVLIAACDGCGERDGGIGHGKKHSRTGPGASWRGS